MPDHRDVSATLNQSALLRARLEVIYDVVHKTAQRSREICDVAWAAQVRAVRVRARLTATRPR